jgi:uncharacterized protein (DUF934 family)
MRYILRRRELTAERAADDELIVPLTELHTEPGRWREHRGRLGVRLAPADAVEELEAMLPALGLVAVEFPSPGEGRGYSQGWLLRERLGFRGEMRAVGAGVRQDQIFLLARCGFDTFELAPGEDPEAARRALGRYDVAYQGGSPQIALHRQRFPRAG